MALMKQTASLLSRFLPPSPCSPSLYAFCSSSSPVRPSLIDTHCHLNMIAIRKREKWPPSSSSPTGLPSFFTKLTTEAQEKSEKDHHKNIDVAGVVHISCSGLINEIDEVYSIIDDYDKMGVCVGVHPSFAGRYVDGHPDSRDMLLSGEITGSSPISAVEERIRETMKHPKTVGWGECGLDYFKNQPKEFEIQKGVFRRQIIEAVRFNKTLVIHCRGDCEKDMLSILHDHLPPNHPTHVHCFSSSPPFLSSLLSSFPNLSIGLTGNITYPSPHSSEIVEKIPLSRLVLESDGPFLPPSPLPRREVSHGGMLGYVADFVAEVKGVEVEEVLERTTENARRLYKLEF